jgi:hypothetical protein
MLHALKEWAVAIEALIQGKTILLMRKGGIREHSQSFTVPHHQVWLYPTYEHQRSELVKPAYASRVNPVPLGWHPDSISIQSWAEITHVFQVTEFDQVRELTPFHIWTENFASERLKWKPSSPLYILLLRVYNLPTCYPIPYEASYGGCRSWIDLRQAISTLNTRPVLANDDYKQQVDTIQRVISRATDGRSPRTPK